MLFSFVDNELHLYPDFSIYEERKAVQSRIGAPGGLGRIGVGE
jgi:hypothetical protein